MNFFNKLPGSAKGIVMVMAMCAPVVTLAAAGNPQLSRWFLGIYVCLGVIGTVGAVVLAKKEKKKSESFSKEVNDNAGDNQGLRDPDKIREVDDMRQQFERGLEIYRQYGKDIYSLPWFVVVGESGSGKTEALRRSELGFPDKLQDYWQGTGGTLSMHWWFTNQGVILDTAGRLFVSDGPSTQGPQTQWTSFLKMLRKNRPECPINGVVLVIPATSLIPRIDPVEEASSLQEIDSKAGQIARQMEVLRSELGVRFPVYLLITKTDRVLGFREFFETVESPAERHQMLGWSNPAGIEQSFDPSAVTQHLRETADRLRGRRMSLLKDPVPTPGSGGRLAEIDALYALPDSFEALAPKLERYLRSLFVVDEWSAPAHFLRGIYFTSALQQGAVLDEALARALGQSMQEMEKGGGDDDLSLARNRSYFLRDFFLEKVFQESGLVVKSGRKAGSGRGWKFWVPASFAAALVVFLGLGWLTGREPSPEVEAWSFVRDEAYSPADGGFLPIVGNVGGRWQYAKNPPAATLAAELEALGSENLTGAPRFGWLFAPATRLDGGVREDREKAYRVAVDQIILRPLIEAAIDTLKERSESWAEGVSTGERDAIKALLDVFGDDSKREVEDLKREIETFTRLAGLSKDRKVHRESLGPMNEAVAIAHPDGRIPASLVSESDRSRFREVIGYLMNSGGGDVEGLLKRFDDKWSELTDLPADSNKRDADKVVAEIQSLSGKLKQAEPQLRGIVLAGSGEDESAFAGGRLAGLTVAKELLTDKRKALETLCKKEQVDQWQTEFARSREEKSERITELITLHADRIPSDPGKRRYHEARAGLCGSILDFVESSPNRWSLEAADGVIARIEEFKRLAKDYGMPEVGGNLLSIAASEYVTEVVAKDIGFPLVYSVRADDTNPARDLDFQSAAGLTVVCRKLSDLSVRARRDLSRVMTVAGAIFNLEKLCQSPADRGGAEDLVLDWRLEPSGDEDFDMDIAEVRISVEGQPGAGFSWILKDVGKEAGRKLLRAHWGARTEYRDVRDDRWHDFDRGQVDEWAVVRWYLRQLEGATRGVTESFNGRSFGLRVIPPPDGAFPGSLEDLPSLQDLKP